MSTREPVPEPADLARFEPAPYDLGITDDPEAAWPDAQSTSYVTEIVTRRPETACSTASTCQCRNRNHSQSPNPNPNWRPGYDRSLEAVHRRRPGRG
jgi:hypothetical protein